MHVNVIDFSAMTCVGSQVVCQIFHWGQKKKKKEKNHTNIHLVLFYTLLWTNVEITDRTQLTRIRLIQSSA